MGLLIPMFIVACSFVVAWLVVANKVHERKLFVFVVAPSFLSAFGYYVPLFLGAMLLFVSIFAKRGFISKVQRVS